MRLARCLGLALLCALLAACQTFGYHQFVVRVGSRAEVVAEVERIARAHLMRDCLPKSDVLGAVACFMGGDSSFTFVGVRDVDSQLVVDVSFRSAGIGGDLFHVVSDELRTSLRRVCGADAVQEPAVGKEIPIVHAPRTPA